MRDLGDGEFVLTPGSANDDLLAFPFAQEGHAERGARAHCPAVRLGHMMTTHIDPATEAVPFDLAASLALGRHDITDSCNTISHCSYSLARK
jgi:hypothetical protein